jgi:CBS domain containing-hemolysin-like protein
MVTNLLLVLLALGLVLLNGFFVAAEFSLVKLRQTRVQAIARKLGWRGRILLAVHRHLDAYLSACQLGITLASLGLGWIGEPAFAELLRPALASMGIASEAVLHGIALFVAFFLISFLHIVVGELAPKSMAIRKPEVTGTRTAVPLYAFYWLMYPVIWLLNQSSNWLLARMGLDVSDPHETHYSTDELKLILRQSRADEAFSADELNVLAKAIDFRNLTVSDLMRPFNEAICLSGARDLEWNLEHITSHRFSRYPFLDKQGKVIGVVHVKDIFFAQRQHRLGSDLGSLLRKAPMVPPDLPATELFRQFQQGASHLAIVTGADSEPLGFITLDNLLGALVGDIRDEFRAVGNDWTRLDDGSLLGKGSLPVFTLERVLGLDVSIKDLRSIGAPEVESVGGMVLKQLGDIPREGQRIAFEPFDVVIKKMKGPKILLVRVYPKMKM